MSRLKELTPPILKVCRSDGLFVHSYKPTTDRVFQGILIYNVYIYFQCIGKLALCEPTDLTNKSHILKDKEKDYSLSIRFKGQFTYSVSNQGGTGP